MYYWDLSKIKCPPSLLSQSARRLAPAPEKWLNNDQKELNIRESVRERKLLVIALSVYRSQSDPGILPFLLQNITGEIAGENVTKVQ